jgi:hypothetical protein
VECCVVELLLFGRWIVWFLGASSNAVERVMPEIPRSSLEISVERRRCVFFSPSRLCVAIHNVSDFVRVK